MTTLALNRHDSLTPALLAALLLHIGLFLAVTLFRPVLPLPIGSAVPINIVSSAPATDSRPAEQAPVTQTAQVEQPVAQAKAPTPPPAVAQPTPAPTPTPAVHPRPAPTPAPKPKPMVKPTPAPAPDAFDLNKLQASISRYASHNPPAPANAARGPSRAETAPIARVDAGQGVSQSDMQGLTQLLERLWNPNCASGDSSVVPVTFSVGDDGRVTGRVTEAARASADALRAIDAVHQAEPYAEAYRGKTFTVNFNARAACAGR